MPQKSSNKVVLGSKFTHVRNEGLSNSILDPYDQKLYCELMRQSWSFGKIQTHKTTWTTLSKLTKISIKRLKKSAAYMENIEKDGEKLIEIEKKGMYIMFFVNPYPNILEDSYETEVKKNKFKLAERPNTSAQRVDVAPTEQQVGTTDRACRTDKDLYKENIKDLFKEENNMFEKFKELWLFKVKDNQDLSEMLKRRFHEVNTKSIFDNYDPKDQQIILESLEYYFGFLKQPDNCKKIQYISSTNYVKESNPGEHNWKDYKQNVIDKRYYKKQAQKTRSLR